MLEWIWEGVPGNDQSDNNTHDEDDDVALHVLS